MTERQGRVGLCLRGYRIGQKISQVEMSRLVKMPAYRLNKIEMSKIKPTAAEMLDILFILDSAAPKFLTLLCLLNDVEPEYGCQLVLKGLPFVGDKHVDGLLDEGFTVRVKKVNGRVACALLNERMYIESGMVADVDKWLERCADAKHNPA